MAENKIKAVSYPVVNQAGEKVSTVKLAGEIFGIEPHKMRCFNAVNTYLSNRRQDTSKTKLVAKFVVVVKTMETKRNRPRSCG